MIFKQYREIITLATPIIALQLAQVALISTDLLMLGLISIEAIAAGGLALVLYNQVRTMCVGMVTGLGNLVAVAIGKGETRTNNTDLDNTTIEEVQNLIRAGLLLATITAIVAIVFISMLTNFLTYFGQNEIIATLAKPIMLALAPGLLPMLWLNVLRQFAVGMRRAGSLLLVTLISVALNAVLNLIFIYGWFGLPCLGLVGIGLATTIVNFCIFFIYLRTVMLDHILNKLISLNLFRAKRETVIHLAKIGMPISLTYGSEAAITSIATIFMGTFGPIALAASNIVNQLAYIVYQFNIGLSHGSSILVSRAIGKGETNKIRDIALHSFTLSFSIMAIIALFYIAIPNLILEPFLGGDNTDSAVLAIATSLLWFAIAHQYFKGSQNILIGLLRGLGNTKAGFNTTIVGYWIVGIPAMGICGYWLTWESYGIWFGLCLGFAVTSVLLAWCFVRLLKSREQQ
ncbi:MULTISPECIES: MATE family efflux transporter [unclassified Francisella]|uniref:MATE family efflux transporter n=1 Tax=unclassified Francisella TaxID=2610885 RepID=UPI002E32CCD8|nr:MULTISPECIES: MATE family efflux transporter [unclassified Francisella]MED7819939.1 MATE family efflux transporter [Francisella sp. 19S2-4]MED7830759.1 MATE family efflux transporter [Francisella sp. 19S2-10]